MRTAEKQKENKCLPHCTLCTVRGLGVCSGLAEANMEVLERDKVYRKYGRGEMIALGGTKLVHIGTVMSGVATLARTQDRGTRQIVGLLQPGDFLGRPWRDTTPFDVEALTEVELCGFRPAVFEDLLARVDGLQTRMTEMILDDLDAARSWMTILARKTAREKIASVLVHMALRQNRTPLDGVACTVDMILTREQTADLMSMTFETVSRQLTLLAQDKIIVPTSRRVFEVPDIHALMQASGEDVDGGMFQD